MRKNGNYLIISDLQIPFEHPKALDFCRRVKKFFFVDDENVINVGDETDQYFGGLWKKSPNATHSPITELNDCRKRLRRWYNAFPKMKLCISNHGTRYWRKALDAEIPTQLLKSYSEIIDSPSTWVWQKRWVIKTKKPFIVEHGDDWGGQFPHKNAALHNGMSTVMGHHHSLSGVEHIKTAGQEIYGMVVGSLIDFDAYAFEYAKNAKFKPIISVGVILDEGTTPIIVPYS